MKRMVVYSVMGLLASVVFVQAVPVQPAGVQPSMLRQASGAAIVLDAPVYAQSSGGIVMRGTGQGAEVGVDYGFGSDFTALFRWRRWRNPLRPGGVISWLNPVAWGQAPYRTLTVLAGELIIIGGTVAIVEAMDDDDGGGGEAAPEPTPAPTTSSSSSGGASGGSSDPEPAPTTTTPSSGGGSSGGSSGSTTTGAGGDELPF